MEHRSIPLRISLPCRRISSPIIPPISTRNHTECSPNSNITANLLAQNQDFTRRITNSLTLEGTLEQHISDRPNTMSTHLVMFLHRHMNTRANLICARFTINSSSPAPVLAWKMLCPSDNRAFRISRIRAIQFSILTPVRILGNPTRAITAGPLTHLLANHFSSTQILLNCTKTGKYSRAAVTRPRN
jgi:hypothetical protein